jgi:hypothetical protein
VTAAGIVLIVIGTLFTLLGLLVVVGGALLGSMADRPDLLADFPELAGAVGGIVAIVGAIVLAFGVIELLSGIFALRGRGWARITAIVVAVLGGLFAFLGVIGSRSGDGGGGQVFNLLLLAAYAFVVWAMATAGRWFAER